MSIIKKLGFSSKRNFAGFFTVVISGQMIYAAFEAFKGSFYNPLREVLGVNNTEFGLLFSLLGIATFFYVPAGWLNNRFSPRDLLISGLILRVVGLLYMVLFTDLSLILLILIAALWGFVDSFFWPAVLNGTRLFSSEEKQGTAFGFLESFRRLTELIMNAFALYIYTAMGSTNEAMRTIMGIYMVLTILWIFLVYKYVPKLELLRGKTSNEKNKEAFIGLLTALKRPEVWLAGIIAMTTYTLYIDLIYTVPYMQAIYGLSDGQAAIFGLVNASAMGVLGGLISGFVADYVFKSPTKMILTSMFLVFITLVLILILPETASMLTINIILLFLFSLAIFLVRAVFFAPVGEANIPREINGSAMSIVSFLAYSPVLWAYTLNGYIIDNNEASKAYSMIFTIGVSFAVVGLIASFILLRYIKRNKTKENEELSNAG